MALAKIEADILSVELRDATAQKLATAFGEISLYCATTKEEVW